MSKKFECYASCLFGMEKPVAMELKALGIEDIRAQDARVYFKATTDEIAIANMFLRCADRVYLVLASFKAMTFEELFQGVKAVDYSGFIAKDTAFPVTSDAVHSALSSVGHVKSISKKAIVTSMQEKYHVERFDETGKKVQVYVNIVKDNVTVCLNTSGEGLNRRGYRVKNAKAPLRETLASGLIHLTRWRDRPFYDIMCGSGTIAIEAALKRKNIAPGRFRKFDSEIWNGEFASSFKFARQKDKDEQVHAPKHCIFASDIESDCVDMTIFHAKKAGVYDQIKVQQRDAGRFDGGEENATILCNPPYGMRLDDQAGRVMRSICNNFTKRDDIRYYFLSGDLDFEQVFGKPSDKKRKLYNGNMLCYFYQYFK